VRAVLDPNVIVSALLSTGTTTAVLDAWLDRQAFTPVVCPTLLAELEEVLSPGPSGAKPMGAPTTTQTDAIALYERLGGPF
jgi:hypothetical protein